MEKNILVTDASGNVIGRTYPKRAKGLLRSGRATEAGEDCIRLADIPPMSLNRRFSEGKDMSQIIEFRARDFRMDQACGTNEGSRQIVTLGGANVECFEIGDGIDKTRIIAEKNLDTDTEYVFRFAMSNSYSGNDRAASTVIVYQGEDVENSFTYPLDRTGKNRFLPVLCKKDGDELVRVFEIPFTTQEAGAYHISILVDAMEARILPAKDNTAYDALPDADYEQWKQEEQHKWMTKLGDLGTRTYESIGELGSQLGEKLGAWGSKISKAVGDAVNSASGSAQKNQFNAEETLKKAMDEVQAAADELKVRVKAAAEAAKEAAEAAKTTREPQETENKASEPAQDQTAEGTEAPVQDRADEDEVVSVQGTIIDE